MNDLNDDLEIESDAQEIKGEEIDAPEVETTSKDADGSDQKPVDEATEKEKIDRAFIKKNKQLQAAKAETQEKERLLQEAQDKIAKFEEVKRPEIPAIPEEFDDDRDKKIAERDKAIRDQTAFDEKQTFLKEQQQQAINKANAEKQTRITGVIDGFDKRAAKIGITKENAEESKEVISRFIAPIIQRNPLAADMVEEVMADDDGPLIFEHLKSNPMELDKIGSMTPTRAAVYIATVVKPLAQKLKPETTKTPDPLFIPEGKGAPKEGYEGDKYMKGGSYQ